jgi:hypothetical protein
MSLPSFRNAGVGRALALLQIYLYRVILLPDKYYGVGLHLRTIYREATDRRIRLLAKDRLRKQEL